tara:strand:- start:140 stop:1069 length:930 start_codon:yes stop_codon:yes gene_type:complete
MPIEKQHIIYFSRFGLIAKQVVEGFLTGLHKSPFHGFSVEFAEHKIYSRGDSTKNIDWKLFARTEKLFLKEFEEETNVKTTVVVDISGSMNFPNTTNENVNNLNKLGFSLYASAALLILLNKQRDASGIVMFDEKVRLSSEIKGSKTHLAFLIDQLESALNGEIKGEGISKLSQSLHQIADQSPKRGLVILFTDFSFHSNEEDLGLVLESLQHLKHNKNEVVIFNVLDKRLEEDFEFGNSPHRFVDLETGEEIKMTPSEFKEKFQAVKLKQLNQIKSKLLNFGIDYIESDINRGFNKVLETYLIKRSKL